MGLPGAPAVVLMRLCTLILLPLAACGVDRESPTWEVRDSAGVRIVEIDGPLQDLPEYARAGDPTLTLGAADGPPEVVFGDVGDVRTLPGGGVLVTDRQDQTLRWYDEDGRFLASAGGRGDGPGEFRLLSVAGIEADTVWMWDPIHQRVTVLSLDRGSGPLITFDQPPVGQPFEVRRLADGSYLARSRFRQLDPFDPKYAGSRVWTDSTVLRHLDPAGFDLDTIAINSAEEVIREIWPSDDDRGRPVGALRPFGGATFWATDSRGNSVTAHGTTGEVVMRDARGTRTVEVRFVAAPTPLPASEVQRLRRARLEDVERSPEFRPLVERSFSDDVLPEFMPRVSAVRIDASGHVWIAEFATFPEEVSAWGVFSSEGEPLGHVSLPEGFTAHEFGRDRVLGVEMDEFGVERIRRYPLDRVGG